MKNFSVKTSNYELSDDVAAYLDEKMLAIEKLLSDPDADTVQCDVELARVGDKAGNEWRAEMNIMIGKEVLRAEARAGDLQSAIDIVKNEMQPQLERLKRKRSSLLKRGGAKLKDMLRFGR